MSFISWLKVLLTFVTNNDLISCDDDDMSCGNKVLQIVNI